jgi:hypothetical protein
MLPLPGSVPCFLFATDVEVLESDRDADPVQQNNQEIARELIAKEGPNISGRISTDDVPRSNDGEVLACIDFSFLFGGPWLFLAACSAPWSAYPIKYLPINLHLAFAEIQTPVSGDTSLTVGFAVRNHPCRLVRGASSYKPHLS